MTPNGPTQISYLSGAYSTQSALDNALPPDTYTYSITAGTLAGKFAGTLTLAPPDQDAFSATPYLTGTSYSSLQGLNAAAGTSVTISTFTPGQGTNEDDIFFDISKASDNSLVYSRDFLPDATTSIAIAAGALATGTSYYYELDSSNRFKTTSGGTTATIAFDTRTYGDFTTAPATIPEPASLVLFGSGLAFAALLRRRLARSPR